MHAVVGMVGEAGELAEAFSKYLRSGKLDVTNFKEEFGDSDWYKFIGMSALEMTQEEVWGANKAKLKARYPEKFCEHKANNRDIAIEKKALEKKALEEN
jgi:NTP pyrophosphatase (non-canonical NTP hydrolase)